MIRKTIVILLITVTLAPFRLAEAQQSAKVPRIGFLIGGSPSSAKEVTEAFQQGLRDLGYIEGQNITIEYRSTEGIAERLPNLVAELVQLKVDIIVVSGSPATQAVKNATKTIPIVMANVNDPVGTGLVGSLAHPGGNVTGLSNVGSDLGGKQLELLKEAFPKVSRVAVLGNSTAPGNAQSLRETERAAGALAVHLQYLDLRDPKDIETAFQAARKGRGDAVLVLSSAIFFSQRTQIANLAVKNRLPMSLPQNEFVEAGGVDELCAKLRRLVPARRCLRGQDFERRAGCSPYRTADEVRVSYQLEDG